MKKRSGLPKELVGYIEYPTTPGILADDAKVSEWSAQCSAIKINKLLALSESYGITPGPNQWFALASRLADEFPGFQPKPAAKRPKRWSNHLLGVLVVELERLIKNGEAENTTSAARLLAKRSPWRQFLGEAAWDGIKSVSPDAGEPLRVKYSKNKNGVWARIYRDAFNYHVATNDMEGWNKFVNEAFIS